MHHPYRNKLQTQLLIKYHALNVMDWKHHSQHLHDLSKEHFGYLNSSFHKHFITCHKKKLLTNFY